MAKSLLLKVLVDVLGKYVEGLKEENLKLGVWSGKIQFFNLKLKESALDELNLPIRIIRGSLKSLIVKIPWTQLESKPVEIYLEGIYALASPLDLSKFTPEDAKRMGKAAKQEKLRGIDALVTAAMTKTDNAVQDTAKKASYFQQLATHIVDNLEVNIKNIHIRYEDTISDPKNVFALGVTLDEISLSTTDDNWNIRYIKRNSDSPISGVIHKLGILEHCGIYWNPKSVKTSDKPYDLWEEYMFTTIFKTSVNTMMSDFVYLLDPQNKLTLKLTHSGTATETTPNVDILIESTTIAFNFDRYHFQQIMLVVNSFDELDKRKEWSVHRPLLRPTVDPRAWWYYAYRLIIGKDISFANKMKVMMLCLRNKDKYISLIKQQKIKESKSEKLDSLSETELQTIEDMLPLSALLVFRETAVKEALQDIEASKNQSKFFGSKSSSNNNKIEEKKGSQEESKKSSFFSGWFSSSSSKKPLEPTSPKKVLKEVAVASEEDDTQIMQSVESRFKKFEEESASAVSSSYALRLKLVSSSKLNVAFETAPLAEMSMNLEASVDVKYSNVLIHCDFGNVYLLDQISKNPYNSQVVQMMSLNSKAPVSPSKRIANEQFKPSFVPQCGFDLSIIGNKVGVKVKSLPLVFTWNDDFLRNIVKFFTIEVEENQKKIGKRAVESYKQLDDDKIATTDAGSVVEVDIEVFAPKVVIPENPQFEERCIFVDAGYLSMNGRMTADGMKWKISLSNINIAMPSKKEQILNSGGNIDYLIKPFDVNLQLHNLDKATADICLDGYISPGVVAEFDAEKIIRLVQAILLIIGTFAEEKEKETEKPRAHLTEKPFQAKSTTPNRKRSLLAIPDDAFKSSTEKATKEGKVVKTNPLKISISLSSLECILYIAEGHNAVLNFSQLSFSFLDRPHDSLINFQMNSLDLIDSNRPEDFKSILLAKSSAQNSDNLVEVKYVILKDKRSPLFDGFQSELELRIADVDAFIDSFTTRTYQTLMKDIMHHYKQCFSRGNPSILILESEQAEAESKPSPPANELQGMKFQFLLNKVSVHVLSRLQPTEPALELGFSFHASKLIAEIKQTELVSGKVSLESVCLTDARSRSAGLFYKTLVSNSPSEGTVSISKNNRLVDLQFYQQDTKTMIVEVKVRDLTTTISIDVIMDFVNLLLANIDSFMAVLAQVNLTQETQDEIAKVSKQRKSSMGRNQDEHDSNSVVINLAVENPNLILLEDPSVEHSKAIAATCAITMQYVKETKNAPASESKDVIHLSVQDAEIFVKLDNSENKIAHRIIEPTALEFHMNSVFMSEINVLLDISISAEEIYIRASLNDLVLGAAIIQRFTDRPNTQGFVEMEGAADNYSVQSQNKKENSSIQKDLTMYRFRFNLAKVQVVLINDYNGQSNPLIRIDASQADISFHGASVDLTGEGSITLQGDYYNTELALWEPLMERWQPSLTFQQTTEGKELSVRYDNFVQINVTSILIRCITNAVMLIGRIGEEGTYCSRGNTHPLTIRNQLGIPVDLYEAGSEKPLIALDHDATVKIPHLSEEVRQSRLAREKEFSRSFDLKFSGEYASSFLTFRDLKLDIHKPKIFQLQNTRGSMQRSVSNYAPVVEEIYQYSRFNMLKNSWESPWTNLGDPNEWADAQGKGGRHPSTITLPPGWDWVEPEWKADLNGMVGKEIDKDGWEYALHFNSFGINTKRRMKQAGDCVRRRRWIRTRYMKQEKRATGESFTGRVVWQVISNPDETKQILLRSTKVVLNRFSVGVEIGAESSFANGNCSKVFKVSASGESSFPLLFSEESGIRVRLQGFESGWSEAFPLVLGKNSSQDSQEFKIYQCLCKNNRLISICLMIMEQDGILNLIVSPLLEVTNFLPCDIQYKASGMQDDVTILSGGKASAIFFQDNLDVIHFFRLGFYTASIPFKFPKKGYNVEEGLSFFSADKSSALHLKMRLLTTTQGIRHILVYSSLLVVDRSNLGAIFVNSQSRDKNSVDWTRRTLSRQTSRKESNYLVDNESWIMGKNGLALFTPLEKKFHIAFSNGSALINDIESSSLSTSKISLDAVDGSAKKCYHIALKSEPYPVAADLCNVVTLMPAFHVVNHLKKRLYLVQKDVNFDQKAVQEVAPKTTVPFHGSSSRRETEIFFKVEGSDWTLGAIDINEIGTSVLLAVNASDSTSPHVFLNVDVRFSSAEENSYITVVVWESKIWKDPITEKVYREGNVIYSIRNDSHVPITMIQNKISVKERLKSTSRKVTQDNEDSKWAIVVSPGIWQPFAFLDPDAGDEFTFLIGTSLVDTIGTPISLKLSRVGTVAYLGAQEERIQLRLEVKANANGKIITVQSCSDMDLSPYGTSTTSSKRSFDDVQQNDFIVNLNVSCFAISVIADKPSRRELFALALRGIFFELRQIEETKDENAATLIFFKLNDMQIDNFSESAVYPVLLRSARIESGDDTVSKRGSPKNLQFIEYSMVIESPKDQSAFLIRYVACRVLEVSVALDSASLLIAASDLLSYVSGSEMSQEKFSLMNAENFNSNMLKQLTYDRLYEVEYQYKASQNQKIFFENLILHPMKFTLDFYPNHFPRKTKEIPPDLRWLTTLESITAVENFQIRIKSFIAENAMESVPSLMERIGNKVLRDIQSDLVQIAGNLVGSLNLIGNPAGLYKNIGSGVQDFFYEPYTGLMSSPGDFLKGIGKGTKGLITGVAGGVVSSAANIVGSATGGVSTVAKGVAAITGDDKYLKKREEKRRELKVTQGGVLEGFKAGGESLVSGFSSGFSGLITKPYEEGQKAGAVGFFKGLGQGLVGVAVKPVIGISEGISSVVQGINQQISDTPGMQHLRPARAFYRRDFQDGSLILVPLDFFAAEAQRFVREKAIKKDYADNFLCAIFLGFNPTAAGDDTSLGFALSEKLLILLSKQIREKWSVPVPSISFVQLVKDENKNYGLKIVLYESNNSGPYRYIPFSTRKAAIDGYDTVYRFRYCFGKPTEMPPVEQAIEYAEAKGAGSPRQDDSKQTKVAHYKFGSANRMDMKLDKMENVADSEFNNRYSYMLKQFKIELPIKPEDEYGYHKLLDDILWRIVSNWAKNHDSILNPSRCCACLIINYSSTEVQLLETALPEGANIATYGVGPGYNHSARALEPFGGAAIIFATGRRPTILNLEHVKVVLQTTAFRSMVSTRENRSTCEQLAGFNAVFLEKSRTDWWAKFVISIN